MTLINKLNLRIQPQWFSKKIEKTRLRKTYCLNQKENMYKIILYFKESKLHVIYIICLIPFVTDSGK